MQKIDKRRHYLIVLDTETANTLTTKDGKLDMSCTLVYDCGWEVVDTHGNVYAERSYVNKDIFVYEEQLMQTAYYAKKLPQYHKDLTEGTRLMGTTYSIKKALADDIATWGIKEVAAHNARFDINALNVTQRYVTKSKYRYFLPYGIEVWDTLKMARSVILKMPTYRRFCEENGYITKTGQLKATAEVLWRYISKENDFQESHTALQDVEIEAQILAYCYKQHKKMNKILYAGKVA